MQKHHSTLKHTTLQTDLPQSGVGGYAAQGARRLPVNRLRFIIFDRRFKTELVGYHV